MFRTPQPVQKLYGIVIKIFRIGFPLLLIGAIALKLKQIGLQNLVHALPRSPMFYILQIPLFLLLPMTEKRIFSFLLGHRHTAPLMVFLRKRVLNATFIEYSGESYFYMWMTRQKELTKTQLFHAIKDSALLSGAAGFVVVLGAALLLFSTHPDMTHALLGHLHWWAILLIFLPVLPALLLIGGNKLATQLSRQQVSIVFLLHLLRSALTFVLEGLVLYYSHTLSSLVLCYDLVTLRLVITRIPFLPTKDMVFLWVGISAAQMLSVSQAALAATLMMMTSIQQILDYTIVGIPWLIEHYFTKKPPQHEATTPATLTSGPKNPPA